MDKISDQRLLYLNPKLAELIRQLAYRLETETIIIHVTQTLRSWQQQDSLYAEGRTTPGPRVTNAPGGYSWHNYGLACDVVPLDQKGKPDWNPAHPVWKRIIDLGESLGMRSGIAWADEPHFEMTGRFSGSLSSVEGDEVRQLFRDGGMDAVWNEAFSKTEVT